MMKYSKIWVNDRQSDTLQKLFLGPLSTSERSKRRNGVLGFIDCCIVLRCCKWSVRFIISVPLLHVSVVMTIGPLTESRPRSKQYTISQTAKAHCCCNIPNNPCTIPTTHRSQYAESEYTLLMFCLLNPQTNACEPNPKTTSSDFNRWKSVTKIFCFHAISTDICLLF